MFSRYSHRRFLPLVYGRTRTETKTVRLDEDVYERIKAHKQDDETFSEAIDRLVDDWSLLDFDTGRSAEEIDRHRELLERSEEVAQQDTKEMLERMGVDIE